MVKLSDGLWLRRSGVKVSWADSVVSTSVSPESEVALLTSTKPIRDRGDTLNGSALTISLSSPHPDIIRVKISHFLGVKAHSPKFELFPDGPAPSSDGVQVTTSDGVVSLQSGGLIASVDTTPSGYAMAFFDDASGETLVRSPTRAHGFADVPRKWTLGSASESSVMATDSSSMLGNTEATIGGSKRYIVAHLGLGVGELVYGLGERFGPFCKNGQNISVWNQDGGTSSDQAYKNVPFFLSNKGYGCFINDPGEVELSIGDEISSRISITLGGESLEYFIIRGPSPKDVLRRYTTLTGKPALPPRWSFGLWLSTSFTTSYDEKTVTGFLQGMQDRSLPLSVFHLDCFWMEQFKWCDFDFDPVAFPDPSGFLGRLKQDFGVKLSAWINSYIAQASPLFLEAVEKGYFIKRTNGDVWQWDLWQPGLAIIDFSNPAACEWYSNKLSCVLDAGVDSLKTDFAVRIPHLGVVFYDGSDPKRMHNYYTQIYNDVVFRLLEKRRGIGEAVLFARSATAGGQRMPIHWGGDTKSSFEAMAESLRGGLSLSMSGFSYWAHDIGGFEGTPDPAVYKRWVAFGLLSSHSRLYGSGSVRVPWIYDDEAVDVVRKFTILKARLMPYIYLKAIESHKTGVPLLRPMILEFPEDPSAHHLDRQYMLGDSLLVAPVFGPLFAEFYVPVGTWTSFMDGRKYTGPRWFKEAHSFLSVPLLVRPGSALVVGKTATLPEYDYTDPEQVEIRTFELFAGVTYHVDVPSGGAEVTRIGGVRTDGSKTSWVGERAPYDLLSA